MEPIVEVVEDIPRRQSVFREILDDDEPMTPPTSQSSGRPVQKVRFRSTTDVFNQDNEDHDWEDVDDVKDIGESPTTVIVDPVPAVIRSTTSSKFYRTGAFALLLVLILPLIHDLPYVRNTGPMAFGVKGGVIRTSPDLEGPVLVEAPLERRQSDPTDICTRFSQQSEITHPSPIG